ncbi:MULTISPECIES: hypothetical protein [unclassified Microcoleus]|uniref:hypothetical protein n=1 Tax=unclassified Microcoleus TaxID=2642155 RepID=UPI002FD5B7E3
MHNYIKIDRAGGYSHTLGNEVRNGEKPSVASHFCSQARNWSFEAGGRRKEETKEGEEVFLQI